MARDRIKSPQKNTSQRFLISEPTINHDERPPIFSLERLQPGEYCLSELDKEHKAAFADSMFKRKDKSWRELNQAPRHGIGFEKIDKTSIKAPIPKFITEDVDYFLAFRFHGKKPMVGYRQKNIFYVLWFDHNYTVYQHG